MEIPDLARLMAAYRSEYSWMINGGGYPMGYGAAILSTFLFNRLISGRKESKGSKIFVFLLLVLMMFMIMMISSFITLASLLIGLVICIIQRFAKSGNTRVFSYVVIGFFSIIIYLNIGTILQFMVNNSTDEFWHKRWSETYDSVVLGVDSHHVDHRQEMYDISIAGFKESPIVGVGYKYGNVFDHYSTFGVGNHSTILDTLAQYGIIGAIPLFMFLLYPYRKSKKDGTQYVHLIPFYLMAYLNPIFTCYHAMCIVFLIIPLIQHLDNIKKAALRYE